MRSARTLLGALAYRASIGAIVAFVALGASHGRADCDPPGSEAEAGGCSERPAGDPAPAPEAAAPGGASPDQPEITSPAAEGARELALAERSLKAAELATTDEDRKKHYRAARDHAARAKERLPRNADARFIHFAAAGRLAQLEGLATAAFQLMPLNAELDEVLRLDPNHANALAARGGMLVKLPRLFGGNINEGITLLERAVTLDDTAIGKRLELAEAYHLVKRDDDASRTANEALAMAEQVQDTAKIETCKRFITELRTTCSGCAMAAIGR